MTKKDKKGRKKNSKNKVDKALKEFYAKKGQTANFIKINGKDVELEYDKQHGLQNAVHLIMHYPSLTLFDFLVEELGVLCDETDLLGRNPFMLNVSLFPTRDKLFTSLEKLLDRGVRFDLADSNGRTPFLIFYEKSNMTSANRLLDKGANIC